MKTAVEWLVNELRNGKEFNDELIEKAKEIEKEQSIELIRQTAMFMAAADFDEDIAHESYLYGHTVGFTKAMEKLQNIATNQQEQ